MVTNTSDSKHSIILPLYTMNHINILLDNKILAKDVMISATYHDIQNKFYIFSKQRDGFQDPKEP